MPDLKALQRRLGVKFKDISLLQQSMHHRSYVNENPDLALTSNERMEFLGDAVLGFATAEKLYRAHPGLSEGDLTKLRSALVRRDTLARVATSLKLGDYLYLGRGEEMSEGRHRRSTLTCALEAVVGAVLLDRGYPEAEKLVFKLLKGEMVRALQERDAANYKSLLQEKAQALWRVNPSYQVINATGPAHEREFTVQVQAGDKVTARGRGKSRKAAEKEAAKAALKRLKAKGLA